MNNFKKLLITAVLLSFEGKIFTKDSKKKQIKVLAESKKAKDKQNIIVQDANLILKKIAITLLTLLEKEATQENITEIIEQIKNLINNFNKNVSSSIDQMTESFKNEIYQTATETLKDLKNEISKNKSTIEEYAVTMLGGKESFNKDEIRKMIEANYLEMFKQLIEMDSEKIRSIAQDNSMIQNNEIFRAISEIKENIELGKINKSKAEKSISEIVEGMTKLLVTEEIIKKIFDTMQERKNLIVKVISNA